MATKTTRKSADKPGLGIKFEKKEWAALSRISRFDNRSKLAEIRWLINKRDRETSKN